MAKSKFVYVTYISSTPDKVWRALLEAKFTRQYWGHDNVSDWKPGSKWEHRNAETKALRLVGEVLESAPPRRLVITWAEPADAKDKSRHTRVAFDIDAIKVDLVRLTVTHDQLEPGSAMESGITIGWPRVLSSLKSLLETGKPLDTWAGK